VALLERQLREDGMSADEARLTAHRTFGNALKLREECRDAWGWTWLDDLRRDVRFGVRALTRTPGFTATAALVLSIGIGGTTAMFSIASAFLVRPFPAPDPEQLVVVAQRDEHTQTPHGLSYSEYLDYRDQNQVFEGLAAHRNGVEILAGSGADGPAVMQHVSPDFFEVLRVGAALGRTFLSGEGPRRDDAPVIVLSHRAWQNRFGADPSVVGRVVRLDTTAHTVIGVTPECLTFKNYGVTPELYVVDRSDGLTNRRQETFSLIGRLRPGVTVAAARANLSVLTTALGTEYPDSMEHSELWVEAERRARPWPGLARTVALMTTLVMTLASLVLLIACAIVATLLVARGIARQREMALRAGLGATRPRLIRQLMSETVLLAMLGGIGGALVALWATELLSTFAITDGVVRMAYDVRMDWRVFAFTAVATTLTGLVAGFAPALRTTRVDLTHAIGDGGRRASGGGTGQRLTSGLVVAQVAMSLVLVVCAGLFVRSGQNAAAIDLGFRTDELLTVWVDPLAQGYDTEQALRFFRDVRTEVVALPGVRSASWARFPSGFAGSRNVATLDGGAIPETAPVSVSWNRVDPAFFDTVDIPVLRGRGFRDEDSADGPSVAVISETAARWLWPEQDPLGKRFFDASAPERPFRVIGVVADTRLGTNIKRVPALVFLPFGRQLSRSATLQIHTDGPPMALVSAVTDAMRRRDPSVTLFSIATLDQFVYDIGSLKLVRLGITVIGAFGALGLVLAAVGLYGVVAYSVSQRRQEFAIRTALGANAGGIVRLAVGRGLRLTGFGLALGFLAAAGVTPLTTGFLVNVDSTDPVVFGVTGLLLASVALLACLVPSRQAAKADPLAALNAE
jgi:putative ABC transport system permease protein